MRNSIIYIFVLCLLCLVSSCVEKEFFEPAQKVEKDTPVVFTATPKGFTKATVGTRAGEGEDVEDGKFNASRFENKIYNAYFLLFDNNGLLRIKEKATIDEEGAVSYNIGRDVLSIFTTFRICFIANITDAVYADFVVNTTKWSDLQSYYFNVTYAPISETGCPGVPQKTDLNNDGIYEYAMPMIGSKEVNAPYTKEQDYYTFHLVRLFARVETHVSLGIQRSGLNLASQPQFTLTDCKIHNIPLSVPLLAQSGPTLCSDTSQQGQVKEEDLPSYNLTTGLNRILYTSSEEHPDYRSFYFYMPEHKLGNCGSNASQSDKPTLVGKTKRPTYISFGGYLVGGDGATYTAEYNIYFGENASDNFDLTRNKLYKNYVRINGVKNADHRVTIVKDEEIKDITRSGQTANCYIIGQEGTYMLPAYKGAFTDMSKAEMCEVGENVVLACDNPNITIEIDQDRSKQSTIVFDVANSSDLLSGNAVIARKDASGNVIWSWHLWFIPEMDNIWGDSVDDLGNPNRLGGLGEADMYDKTTMADRNLGVNASVYDLKTWLPSTIEGIYYKYGYHNPYFEDKKYGNGAAYHGINSNDYEEWNGNAKSKTDPCPPGYRVPPISVWQGSNEQNATKEHYTGMFGIDVKAFRYWNRGRASILDITDDIYYPYTGYMIAPGVYKGDESTKDFKLEDEIEVTGEDQLVPGSESSDNRYNYRDVTRIRTIYSEFIYSVPLDMNFGEMLTQNQNNVFHYEFSILTKSNIQNKSVFKSAIETKYEIKVTQRKRKNLSRWSDYNEKSRTQTSQKTITSEPSLSTNWRTQAASDQFGMFSSEKTSVSCNTTASMDSSRGYNIRCIKE